MKKNVVRLCLWLILLTGLFFSFRQLWDAKKAEESSREAAWIAGISELSGSDSLVMPETGLAEDKKTQERNLDVEGNAGTKGAKVSGNDEENDEKNDEGLPQEAAVLAKINLEALQKVNSDVQGWIAIPGTKLSYPIVQGKDNAYYLKRNWKKEDSISGSIFLESTNSSDFSDFHTLIYGHRMRDGSMFGVLKNYQNPDFWREHPRIYLVFGDGICSYDIFAAYETGVESMVYRLDLEEKGMEKEFFQFCRESSVFDADVTPEPGAGILTLSTCTGWGHATRWVVQGCLVDKYSVDVK